VLAFQRLDHHRTGAHETDQCTEERALAMDGIEAFGFLPGQVLHLRSHDLQAGLLETGINLADDVLGDSIGLDDRKGALQRHWNTPVWRAATSVASPTITENNRKTRVLARVWPTWLPVILAQDRPES